MLNIFKLELFSKNHLQIFLISFLILFTEFATIRYLSAEIVSLAFFSNIILMACFFGIGLGCLFYKKKNLFNYFPFLIVIQIIAGSSMIIFDFESLDMVMYQSSLYKSFLNNNHAVLTIIIFIYIAFLFYPLGQMLGIEFNKSKKSIDAYLFDLSGSIFGVLFFTILSFFETGIVFWIIVINLTWMLIAYFSDEIKFRFCKKGNNKLFLMIFGVFGFWVIESGYNKIFWTKYYKIVIQESQTSVDLFVNKSCHQAVPKKFSSNHDILYGFPYKFFKNPQYENVLIIGSGMGNDASYALKNNVKNVDAVEIDQRIYESGLKYHLDKPYQDPRLKININDGRNYLENNQKKYDLIIFALTDSLTLASSQANTRLESYLYTKESLLKAKEHLSENGMIVLYNYYRQDWIVDKISGILEEIFNQQSIVTQYQNKNFTIIANGYKLKDFKNIEISNSITSKKSIKESSEIFFPTDNWPFLYLKKPSFPNNYIKIVVFEIILLLVLFLFLHLNKEQKANYKNNSRPYDMLFLGIGFMLLETKNIINFQLLFGSTWDVNFLVILAILLTALISTIIIKLKIKFRLRNLYFMMAISLMVSIAIPISFFSNYDGFLKYLLSCLVSFSPMLFASLIFSQTFSLEKKSALGFGYNMIGAMIGGMLEYGSMLYGYHKLLYVIALAYILALLANYLRSKENI